MAEFEKAFRKILSNEGMYSFDKDDAGGETYKGIARKIWPKWEGWTTIDIYKVSPNFDVTILEKDSELQSMVQHFYQTEFWDKMNLDKVNEQEIAESIFDFAVNAGTKVSVSLAQLVIGTKPDGVIGNNTLTALNTFNKEHFLAAFIVAKIARYVNIVKKRPVNKKYFYGWIVRALGEN